MRFAWQNAYSCIDRKSLSFEKSLTLLAEAIRSEKWTGLLDPGADSAARVRGSCDKRNSHSRPAFDIHLGARRTRPATKLRAAPIATDTVGRSCSRARWGIDEAGRWGMEKARNNP